MELSPARFMTAEEESGTAAKFVHVEHLYSTPPCISTSGASNVMSKKVKARKVIVEEEEERVAAVAESMAALGSGKPRDFFDEDHACTNTPRQRVVQVYHRRAKRPRHCWNRPSFFESVSWKIDPGSRISGNGDEDGDDDLRPGKKQKSHMKHELLGLCGGNGFGCGFSRPRMRVSKCTYKRFISGRRTVSSERGISSGVSSSSGPTKRWVE